MNAISELQDIGVKYLSIPMVYVYPAAKAMSNALKMLKNGDLTGIGEIGVSWSEFNDLIGFESGGNWRMIVGE